MTKAGTYKSIEEEYKKIDSYAKKMKGSNATESGGFFNGKTEKKYNRAIKSWKKYFIENKKGSSNITYINSITFETKGNISMHKDFYNALKNHVNYINSIFKEFKSNKNIVDKSHLTIFMNIYNLLTDSKYVNAFKVAYDEYNKNKADTSVVNIFVMCHQLLVSYLFFTMGTINPCILPKASSLNEKEFEEYLENTQKEYNSLIETLGFTSLEVVKNLELIKNPSDEIKKAIKTQQESSEKLAKAKESCDSTILQNTLYEISEESYVEENQKFGTEEALTVVLIVLGSIIGLFAIIAGIRRAIYLCGTLKTDISEYIKVDVVTVMMNIESLKEKLDNTTDEKERKRLQSIIDKQQKFVDRFSSKYQDLADESDSASYEATYTIEEEDSSDSQDNSYNDDYDILI